MQKHDQFSFHAEALRLLIENSPSRRSCSVDKFRKADGKGADRWQVTFGNAVNVGTVYLPDELMPRTLPAWGWRGQAWKYFNRITTYYPCRDVIYKNLATLKTDNEEDFWNVLRSCAKNGLAPPSSFADIFQQLFHAPLAPKGLNAGLCETVVGGWQRAFESGRFSGKVRQYDLNQAYRWAASCGLPDLATARVTLDFTEPDAVFLVNVPPNLIPYAPYGGPMLVTSLERDALALPDLKPIWGRRFTKWIDLKPLFGLIQENFPYCYKRIGRAFWGRWNTRQSAVQCSWAGGTDRAGKQRLLANICFNPVWAHYVTSRVKLRLCEYMTGDTLHVFVDSILTYEQLPTGDQVGDFRQVAEYDDLWIRGPGQFGVGKDIVKHCGVAERDINKWQVGGVPL